MELDIYRLPKKANRTIINEILKLAEDKLYIVTQIDYNTGLVRFESSLGNKADILIYTTKLTIGIENRKTGYIKFYKNCSLKKIEQYFNKYQKF